MVPTSEMFRRPTISDRLERLMCERGVIILIGGCALFWVGFAIAVVL